MILGAALGVILSASQLHWAQEAYNIGAPYDLGYTLVALEGQESSYCEFKVNGWSRGCLGVKRSTARLFDARVTRLALETDNYRNLLVGLAYLLYCRKHTTDWRRMVAAYHYGVPVESQMSDAQIDADGYVKAIQRRLKEIEISHE